MNRHKKAEIPQGVPAFALYSVIPKDANLRPLSYIVFIMTICMLKPD